MERFWCLRWLQQQQITTCTATVLKEDLIRLNNAPLVARLPGLPQLGRGQQIELHITGADELALELEARYVSLIDTMIEASDLADEGDAGLATATEIEADQTEPLTAAAVEADASAISADFSATTEAVTPANALATAPPESSNTGSAL